MLQVRDEESKTTRFTFDSWGEHLEYACTRKPETIYQDSRSTACEFNGGVDWKETIRLANEGWPEGLERARHISDAIVDKVTSLMEKQNLEYDVSGIDFDMGLLMSGAPECWYRMTTTIEDGVGVRHVRVVFNIGARATVSTETMILKGAAGTALIQALELAGIRCEVILASHATDGCSRAVEFFTLLKEADQQLDMDRLIFALAHPASHRRIVFSIREGVEGYSSPGSSQHLKDTDKGDVYIERSVGSEPQWSSPESAIEWVFAELRRQGVKFTDDIE